MAPLILIKAALPLIAPVIVGGLKKITPGLMAKVRPELKPVLSLMISLAIASLTGQITSLESLGAYVFAALGAVKIRDMSKDSTTNKVTPAPESPYNDTGVA